ncbi:MAG: lipopolysaccharide biosynthesis protein [Rhodobacteraceae bacterium]|nr:lipopolysaccharide biosynthesis protein [Paracoccaceae bacterium]
MNTVLRRLVRNTSWVFAAQAVSALLGVASLALMARGLGPAGLGVLAASQAYVRILDRLLRLEPWQAVVRFGIEAIEASGASGRGRFLQLVKLSVLIDLGGGLLAGCAALAAAPLAASWLDLPPEGTRYLELLAAGLFVNLRATGLGVLRVLDRFDILGKADVAVAAGRLVLCALVYAAGLGIWGFLAVMLLESLANGLLAFWLALRLLPQEGYAGLRQQPLAGVLAANPGLIRLLWASNINVILRQTGQRLDVLILSALAGNSAAGSFHLARRIAEALVKFGKPLVQAIYPELSRKWAAGDAAGLQRLALACCAMMAAAGGGLLLLLGPYMAELLRRFAGAEFAAAAPAATVQMAAAGLLVMGMVLGNALLSMDRGGNLVQVAFFSLLLFLAAIVPLVQVFGLLGAALAHALLGLSSFSGNLLFLRRGVQEALQRQPAVTFTKGRR